MKVLNLKVQITFFVILLVAGLVSAFSWTIARMQQRILYDEITQKVVLQGRNLALSYAKPLLHNDPEFELHPHISKVLDNNPDVVSIAVVDGKGLIKGHRDLRLIDTEYESCRGFDDADYTGVLEEKESLWEDDAILKARIPITDQSDVIGYVFLEYSKGKMKQALNETNGRIIRIGLIALAVGSVLSLLLAYHITRPVNELSRGAELIGRGNLDTRIKVRSVREIQTLADTFNDMASSLEAGREVLREKERMDKELEIAKSIQDTLLPSDIPKLKNMEIEAYYNPARTVGGDYFDLIQLNERRLMLVMGDVAGKGVPGLLIMAMARIMVRDLAARGEGPADLLMHLNRLLKKDMKDNFFITMFCSVFDTASGKLSFASAAHMPLYFYRHATRTVHVFKTGAKPLGIFNGDIFSKGLEEKSLTMESGDLIFQYTDGVSEMRNESNEEFGFERIGEVFAREANRGAAWLLKALMRKADEFRGGAQQSDDLSMLAMSLNAVAEESSGGSAAGKQRTVTTDRRGGFQLGS